MRPIAENKLHRASGYQIVSNPPARMETSLGRQFWRDRLHMDASYRDPFRASHRIEFPAYRWLHTGVSIPLHQHRASSATVPGKITDASPTPIPRGPVGSITVMDCLDDRMTWDIKAAVIHPDVPPTTITIRFVDSATLLLIGNQLQHSI